MTTLSRVDILDVYPSSQAGTVEELAGFITQELLMSGYSLSQDDVISIILAECRYYAGWAMFEAQNNNAVKVDESLVLDAYEWSILEPVIRSHINYKQALRVEAIKSLGAVEFGLGSSEANQLYEQLRAELPKNAFVAPPYSIELD